MALVPWTKAVAATRLLSDCAGHLTWNLTVPAVDFRHCSLSGTPRALKEQAPSRSASPCVREASAEDEARKGDELLDDEANERIDG